jgi:hypothetical protein
VTELHFLELFYMDRFLSEMFIAVIGPRLPSIAINKLPIPGTMSSDQILDVEPGAE